MSRCHAFKKRVENSDKELRQYIKGITVIVEEPITQMEIHPAQQHQVLKNDHGMSRQEIHITRNISVSIYQRHTDHILCDVSVPLCQILFVLFFFVCVCIFQDDHHQVQNVTIQQPQTHMQQPTTQQIVTTTSHQPQQMIITNGQLHNAQIINAAGQIVGTAPIQQTLATAQLQTGQICQLVQTSMYTFMGTYESIIIFRCLLLQVMERFK